MRSSASPGTKLTRPGASSGSRPPARRRWWGGFSRSHTPLPRRWRDGGHAATPTARSSSTATAGRPGSDRFRGHPHRHIAASNEGLIVGRPVRHPILRLIPGMNLRLHPRSVAPAEGPEKCGPRRPTRSGYSCNNAVTNSGGERLPYTLAVHHGEGENAHAHLMFSERAHVGIRDGGGAGLRPRTAGVLWRQTIEGTLRDFWLAQETAAAVVSSEPRLPPPPVRTQSHCPARRPPLALHSNAAALVSRSPHASTRSRLCQA